MAGWTVCLRFPAATQITGVVESVLRWRYCQKVIWVYTGWLFACVVNMKAGQVDFGVSEHKRNTVSQPSDLPSGISC